MFLACLKFYVHLVHRNPVSVEENSPQLEKSSRTLPSPPVPNVVDQALGQPRLSPAGVAALSAGFAAMGGPSNIPLVQQNIPISTPQRKLSGMVLVDSCIGTLGTRYC